MFGANAITRAIVGDGEVTYTHSGLDTGRGGKERMHDVGQNDDKTVKWFYVLNFGALQDVVNEEEGGEETQQEDGKHPASQMMVQASRRMITLMAAVMVMVMAVVLVVMVMVVVVVGH